jgi:phospholipase A1
MRLLLCGLFASACMANSHAADLSACLGIQDDPVRLACYDKLAKEALPEKTVIIVDKAPSAPPALPLVIKNPLPASPVSALSERWELDPQSKAGVFQFRAHNPTYILPVYATSDVNERPSSPAPGRTLGYDRKQQTAEVKFQISFKTKLAEDMFDGQSDLWFGYTQQSWWQLYNEETSRNFRETNYEPELILTTRTDYDLFGWKGRMVNLGLLHQSNGRDLPLSRSWNRVYAQAGLERGDWALLVRPWYRIPDKASDDDNPDISRYMGYGDVTAIWKRGGHLVTLLGRLNAGTGKGAAQVDWAFPISRQLKGYVQLFSGYGDSMIDYNHKQTTLGVGVSLSDGL